MHLRVRLRAMDEAGAPVEGAVVRHHDEDVAVTNADGIALVEGLHTGFDSLAVHHDMPTEARLTFSLGEGSCGVVERTVILHRGALLAGTVVAPDGTPLPDALVEVWCASEHTRYLESDARGAWSVPAMQAGDFEVRAGSDTFARGSAVCGTHDGSTPQRDLVVRVAVGARLFGRVRDAAGSAVGDACVSTEMQPGDDRCTTTDSDGRFEIAGLNAGRHAIVIAGGWRSSLVMPADGEQLELDVELPPPAPARERAPSTDPLAPADQTATLTGRVLRDGIPVLRFAVVRKGSSPDRWLTDPAIVHAPDGRFTLAVDLSSYSVHVLALGSGWASSETIEPAPRTTHDLGDIALPPGAQISGIVCNEAGEPVSGAIVETGTHLHGDPLQDAVAGTLRTTSRADGTFLLEGALHERDPWIVASHPVHGTSLEHHPTHPIRLVLVPTGAIDGVLESYNLQHGGVLACADAPGGGARSVTVRPSGRYAFEDLVPGDYAIDLVQRRTWPRCTARVTVIAGQREQVRLRPA